MNEEQSIFNELMSSEKFYIQVVEMRKHCDGYLESIINVCEDNDIDIEDAAKHLMSPVLLHELECEGVDKKLFTKTYTEEIINKQTILQEEF